MSAYDQCQLPSVGQTADTQPNGYYKKHLGVQLNLTVHN